MSMIKPFSIVTAPYIAIDGEIKKFESGDKQYGIFIVLHLNEDKQTCLCAKLTSNRYLTSVHSVILPLQYAPFLRTQSIIQVDKLHTLGSKTCKVLGYINDITIKTSILNSFSMFNINVVQSLSYKPIKNYYTSPNVRKEFK